MNRHRIVLLTTVSFTWLVCNGDNNSYKTSCDVSEFLCPSKSKDGALCLPMDRWCDGRDDCHGRIDEPRSCTICNRTYFGRIGSTYRLSVIRPRMVGNYSLPWRCWMNFTALGGTHGNQILLSFESFAVGRLNSSKCQGGQLKLRDTANTDEDWNGAWCGQSWGQPMFRSDGPWVKMDLLMDDILEMSRFRLDLTYRFLPQPATTDKLVTYGEPVPGTQCSRNLHSCDQKTCTILSPNFPGLYPRNATCYYYIRQSWKPRNTTVLISVGQRKDHLFSLRTSTDGERNIVSGHKCSQRDSLSIYNGATVESPLLAEICGSGNVPRITGLGSEMLVVFRTSSFDTPYNPAPLGFNTGFSLDVVVQLVGEVSPCKLRVDSSYASSGTVNSPEVTLPANSSCVYEFVGKPNERVWIALTSYSLAQQTNTENTNQSCMTIIDGNSVVERNCGSSINPRLCIHARNPNNQLTRPCHLTEESYVSTSNIFRIEQDIDRGTLIEPWKFSLRYEFVTVDDKIDNTDNQKIPYELEEDESGDCRQYIKSSDGKGRLSSPQNLFMFGRGGKRNLTCIYYIESSPKERISLSLTNFHVDDCCGTSCSCSACAEIDEYFWYTAKRPLVKLCSSLNKPLLINSSAPLVSITFQVTQMNWAQDFTNFYFSAEYSVIQVDTSCTAVNENANRGSIEVLANKTCSYETPWYVKAPRGGHILFQLPHNALLMSASMPEEECLTNNRLLFYSVNSGHASVYREICLRPPLKDLNSSTRLFSPGWNKRSLQDDLIVVPSIKGDFSDMSVSVPWMVVYKDFSLKSSQAASQTAVDESTTEFYCFTPCRPLGVCLSPSAWCDKFHDCPDGSDESDCVELSFWPVYVGIGFALALAVTASYVIYLVNRSTRSRSYAIKQNFSPEVTKSQFATLSVAEYKRYDKAGPGS